MSTTCTQYALRTRRSIGNRIPDAQPFCLVLQFYYANVAETALAFVAGDRLNDKHLYNLLLMRRQGTHEIRFGSQPKKRWRQMRRYHSLVTLQIQHFTGPRFRNHLDSALALYHEIQLGPKPLPNVITFGLP